jgi:hypothetical protein
VKKYNVGIWCSFIRLWAKKREGLLKFARQFSGSIGVLTKLTCFHFPHKDSAAMQWLLFTVAILFSLRLKRRGEVRIHFLGSVCQQMTPHSKAHDRNTMAFSTFLKPSINPLSICYHIPHWYRCYHHPTNQPSTKLHQRKTMWNIRSQSYEVGLGGRRDWSEFNICLPRL